MLCKEVKKRVVLLRRWNLFWKVAKGQTVWNLSQNYQIKQIFCWDCNDKCDTVSVLGQDEGYTVKHTTLPEGVPNTDSVSF